MTLLDTPKSVKEQTIKYSLKISEYFLNKVANDETKIKTDISNEYFKYHNPSFPVKDLYNVNQTWNEKTVNQVDNAFIDLRNGTNKKEGNQYCWKNPWL